MGRAMNVPRFEHPRPQFERLEWKNLNGVWSYSFDFSKSGLEKGLAFSRGFENEITVPFCPESKLSGVGYTDFIEMMWYHRKLEIPSEWEGRRILLHFGGVDYESEVFIDGKEAGRHWGGVVSFCHDISDLVEPGGVHDLVVYVRDDTRSGVQPGGKQNPEYRFKRKRCHYTRTTGIWQTVWLEAVHPMGLKDIQLLMDIDEGRLVIVPRFRCVGRGISLSAAVLDGEERVAEGRVAAVDGIPLVLGLKDMKLWQPDSPFLYGLELEVVDEEEGRLDRVLSYAGMRKVHVEGEQVFLNNRPIYQRLVLDQGFYPDGVWTAPSDGALRRDIEIALAAGFNGARLHQKVFEERFHYWADRLGYLTWGEFPSWGAHVTDEVSGRNILSEWAEMVVRDRNHPSIITWTPLNETRFIAPDPGQQRRLHADLYELTHMLDPTRPVNDTSGYIHVRTDIWTVHEYLQDPDKLRDSLKPKEGGEVFRNYPEWEVDYTGQPYVVAEFGGILWIPKNREPYMDTSWGYGEGPSTEEEYYERLEALVAAILSHPHICGFCYTQLTDVEQEQNGIYNFDRSPKFDDMGRIARIFAMQRRA
jgi:beta-galactosidase/beta-glucuronidase